jgi:hypothetical protein
MKKTLIISLFFTFTILAGCTKQKDTSFARKVECAKLIDQTKEIAKNSVKFSNDYMSDPEIFYSPALDTCIGTWQYLRGEFLTGFYIIDLITNKTINQTLYTDKDIKEFIDNGEDYSLKYYYKKITDLKK